MKLNSPFPWDFTVKRSKRKTLSVEILPSRKILVKAPLFYSESEILRLLQRNEEKILRRMEILEKLPPCPVITFREREELCTKAKALLPPMVERWSLCTGLKYRSLRISKAEKRFGSCNSKAGISLTCYLADLPTELCDYVIVHELCHTIHLNHSGEFYALLARILPDYREREKKLKSIVLPTVLRNESTSKKENLQ